MTNNRTLRKLLLIGFRGVRRIGKSIYTIRRVEGETIIKVVEVALYLSRIDYIKVRRQRLVLRGRG